MPLTNRSAPVREVSRTVAAWPTTAAKSTVCSGVASRSSSKENSSLSPSVPCRRLEQQGVFAQDGGDGHRPAVLGVRGRHVAAPGKPPPMVPPGGRGGKRQPAGKTGHGRAGVSPVGKSRDRKAPSGRLEIPLPYGRGSYQPETRLTPVQATDCPTLVPGLEVESRAWRIGCAGGTVRKSGRRTKPDGGVARRNSVPQRTPKAGECRPACPGAVRRFGPGVPLVGLV